VGVATPVPIHLEERAVQVRRSERSLLALAAGFVGVSAVTFSLGVSGGLESRHLWAPAIWAAAFLGAHLVFDRFQPLRDPLLLPIVGLLSGWGLVLVDRLAPSFLVRQAVWVAMGVGAMMLLALWPRPRPGDPAGLRWLRRYRYTWLLAGLGLLGLTLVVGINPSGAGLRLWLGGRLPIIGPVHFQPSELLKLLMVVFLASYMAEKEGMIRFRFQRVGPLAPSAADVGREPGVAGLAARPGRRDPLFRRFPDTALSGQRSLGGGSLWVGLAGGDGHSGLSAAAG
jgi:hypothetical protein